jgi:hypothetical protein
MITGALEFLHALSQIGPFLMSAKTVFISYRRDSTGRAFARSVKQELTRNGYDVFFDVDSLDPGKWADQILTQVPQRSHFLLLLTPGALDRCVSEDDWVRREFETAVSSKRNIVPVREESVDMTKLRQDCPESMKGLLDFQIVTVENSSFESDIERLIEQYIPPHRAPAAAQAARSTDRARSPRDYIDETVSRIATNLQQTKPLTMRSLVLELNQLFNRSTFRFEPLKECITKEWGTRLHAAMQTLELLRRYSTFASDQAPDDQTFERLMDEVNGYCLAMAAYLFQGPVKVSDIRRFLGTDDFVSRLPAGKDFEDGISDEVNNRVDGPRIRAIEQMDLLRKNFVSAQSAKSERSTYIETPGDEAEGEQAEEVVGAGVAGVNVEADTIDGCNVDFIDETPDEDLPLTEGGVA